MVNNDLEEALKIMQSTWPGYQNAKNIIISGINDLKNESNNLLADWDAAQLLVKKQKDLIHKLRKEQRDSVAMIRREFKRARV